ncbi:MAG: periplasmic heavy metal sensor [Acidobacteriia bacterium]|nr:periplasmic heavy metal sensor [Terriglobia bacterium]
MKKSILLLAVMIFILPIGGLALAQETPPPAQAPAAKTMPPPMMHRSAGPASAMGLRGPGKWWKNSELMQKLGVRDDQIQRIEKIFQDQRLQLIDLHAALDKQEAILEPLVEADQPDESQVFAQIDKVAQARANLEKSNAQMLLAIRRVLTVDQWKQLRDQPGIAPNRGGRGFGPPAPPAAPPPAL